MKTLQFFGASAQSIPQSTAWYLADLGEYLGKQELYTRQSPQKLKALKEHAIIESAVSSNEQSSKGWHEGKHDPFPYLNFVFSTLKAAYKEFEERAGSTVSPRGSKTEMVQHAVHATNRDFTVADMEEKCPAVSRDMIRTVLKAMQKNGAVECIGRGPGALWRKKG